MKKRKYFITQHGKIHHIVFNDKSKCGIPYQQFTDRKLYKLTTNTKVTDLCKKCFNITGLSPYQSLAKMGWLK